MTCDVKDNQLIIGLDGNTYSFIAHGEKPRPSMLGANLSAGGKHWSDRNPEITLEKHTGIQEVECDGVRVAWYTQEFKPDGEDYKMTKNACIHLGDLATGGQKQLYKGECYGDLCFYKDELFFNMGNKVAVVDLESGEVTELFKHSGVKKNNLRMHISDTRIFYVHWSGSDYNLMCYDRTTQQIKNPHLNTGPYYYPDDSRVICRGVSQTWVLDADTLKKKQLFSSKQIYAVLRTVTDFLKLPFDEYNNDNLNLDLRDYDGERLYFRLYASYYSTNTALVYPASVLEATERMLPHGLYVELSSDSFGKDIRLEFTRNDINVTTHESRWGTNITWRTDIRKD